MRVTPIRTPVITPQDRDLLGLLDRVLPPLQPGTVVAISAKIVALSEGRVVPAGTSDLPTLVQQEASWYLPPEEHRAGFTISIVESALIPNAGIDESNSAGGYVLWPADPQTSANTIRAHLARRGGHQSLGVLLTDSTVTPLRRGVLGLGIAHSGFAAINNVIGQPDVFGRPLRVTQVNVRDALAAAAVVVMGESHEQTPLALIETVPFVVFQDRDPTPAELRALRIPPEEDLYGPLLTRAPWHRGGRV